jgi:transcriptional regulator with XRE-family HTH domain
LNQVQYPSSSRKSAATGTNRQALICALTLASLVGGTAGTYQVDDQRLLESVRHLREPRGIELNEGAGPITYAPSVAELLVSIRDVFGLKISELAQVFGVSRRAVYDWLGGTVPKPEMLARFHALNVIANDLKNAGVNRVEHFLHRPLIAQRTLLDFLKSGEDLESAVAVVKHTAASETEVRAKAARRPSRSSKASDGFDEESTPIVD